MCKKEPFWAKKNTEKWEQLKFNISFLKKINKKEGSLHCEYCGKDICRAPAGALQISTGVKKLN